MDRHCESCDRLVSLLEALFIGSHFVDLTDLARAIYAGAKESTLTVQALVCVQENELWTWLVLVAPTGPQQSKIEEAPCYWIIIPRPSLG